MASSENGDDRRKRFRDDPVLPIKVAIEGNIAAGKSTFLRIIDQQFEEYTVVQEPLSRWTNVKADDDNITHSQQNGGNLLDMFYKDTSRWAYTFQTYAFLSRMRAQMKPVFSKSGAQPLQLFERSVYSDRYCFAQNCAQTGLFSEMEWNIYCDWHTFLMESFKDLRLDGIIYLRATPETCFKRVNLRKRAEEDNLPLPYLESIHQRHEEWLINKTTKVSAELEEVPILVIDCNEEFETDPVRCNQMIDEVQAFLAKVQAKQAARRTSTGSE